MPEPVSATETSRTMPGWEDLRPAGEDAAYLMEDPGRREAMVKGLRGIADLFEARTDIPVPDFSREITVFVDGTTAEKLAQIDHVAGLLGTPVTDNRARGGHYLAQKSFGPVSYQVVATEVGDPAYAIGDHVRLNPRYAAGLAKAAGTAQIGYIAGIEKTGDGAYSYSVHFPGRAGTQGGWAPLHLNSDRFPPIKLSHDQVTSIQEAENLLIDLTARLRTGQADPQAAADREVLCRDFAKACGLEPAELSEQIEAQVEERIRSTRSPGRSKTAPELAGSDGQRVTATINDIPVQEGSQQAPRRPVATRARGKER